LIGIEPVGNHVIPLNLNTDLESILNQHFDGLHSGGGRSSIKGGQTEANRALDLLDISGYAKNRSEVLPLSKRGATLLSPYIRHNLLTLQQVWNHVSKAPYQDRKKFRDELLWQEYARHLYARIGTRLFENLRFEQTRDAEGNGWPSGLACTDFVLDELATDGWLVNQTRMWLASHWTVRNNVGWIHGQEKMFRELIDGSRAANLLGWQWTVGSGTGKPYGFARWQVEKRAPELCRSCPLAKNCPIENFPEEKLLYSTADNQLLGFDPNLEGTSGPLTPLRSGKPTHVLLTVESLGDADPALSANQDLPAVFVFNEAALRKLQLSSKRIYFYLETLKDLSQRRDLKVFLGDPVEFANSHDVAVTYAPVPSFRKFQKVAELHPYPWLVLPHAGSVRSYSSWVSRTKK
jgi:deoxyribodipyrimidine photo-lyase